MTDNTESSVEFIGRIEDLGGFFDVDGTPTRYIVRPGAVEEGKEVPLTMYVAGVRHVIGTAVVRDGNIHATLADTRPPEVSDALAQLNAPMAFSLAVEPETMEVDEVAAMPSYQQHRGLLRMPERDDLVAQIRKFLGDPVIRAAAKEVIDEMIEGDGTREPRGILDILRESDEEKP